MAESRAPKGRRWLALAVFVLALYVLVRAAETPQDDAPRPSKAPRPGGSASAPSAGSAAASPPAAGAASYDPAAYAAAVRTWARRTGTDARLLMAILYNEAYKPHTPAFERAWQKYKPDAAFGIANMHRATFDQIKRGRDFAGRRWAELPDDRDLAIEAEAWYVHDLAARLPAARSTAFGENDLLALGYNAGEGNMLAFARGAEPGSDARSYVDRLHANWGRAGRAVGTT
ncbi:lytic transglycosylase domain-containing protein [Streptomyces tropicalis]|uniref:Lytic transglycosylase domain-containing protein n=1 Tax=Streptomyces tropicalis TaxID=3034234 RepID=A0ABT6AD10_9ACTN|nr:lytic transglycosylase domain-containing protein [Streptomyces tropicalis]MDF3302532.1 lytic transglycosylase domain-containing protein [Streptomyces tropicalis]